MINILFSLTETWIEISPFANRILDPQCNLSVLESKKAISTSINFWLIDSKIYSLFVGYKNFGFSLRYYDFGSFTYQNEFPNDNQNLKFSPFSIYASLGKKFKVEDKFFVAFNLGYYENRVLDQIMASPFVSLSSNLKPLDNISLIFSIENFSFKKLFSANQIELPTVISGAINSNLKQFNVSFGANKYYTFEKFISIEYKLRNLLNVGLVWTPDYDYSKISTFMRVKYRNLYIGYRVLIPSYLNFTNTISLSYETP